MTVLCPVKTVPYYAFFSVPSLQTFFTRIGAVKLYFVNFPLILRVIMSLHVEVD
jgi:hypothetical protein